MAKKELYGFLKPGEKVTAKYLSTNEDKHTFQRQNGETFVILDFSKLNAAIQCADDFQPILEIERRQDNSYKIEELDEWPGEESKDDDE